VTAKIEASNDWRSLVADQARQHERLLYRLAFGVLRDAAGAEDACQQALLKALEKQEQVRDGEPLKPWLCRVVLNEAFVVLRRRKTEARAMNDRRNTTALHQDACDAVEQRESIMHAMEQLPEPTRTIVVLRVIQGWSGNDVKDQLGCSASEVSRRLHQGLEHLRGLIRDGELVLGG